VLSDFDSAEDIGSVAGDLLKRAHARGRFPTPVSDIVEAANLSEPGESLLAPSLIAQAPEHLRIALRRLRNKAQALVDLRTREVHLNPDIVNRPGASFKKLHEVGHAALPWQAELAYADDNLSLSPETRELFEREASQCAAELLFQQEVFQKVASDFAIGIGAIYELSGMFGASFRATLHRYAEGHRAPVAGLVLRPTPSRLTPLAYRRYEWVGSASWCARFGEPDANPGVIGEHDFPFLAVAHQCGRTSLPTAAEVRLLDVDGEALNLRVEVMSNHYRLLALLWVPQREVLKRRSRIFLISMPRLVTA
jgi:hypothetical protein